MSVEMSDGEKMIWAAAYALSMYESHKPKVGVGERERYEELESAVAQAIHDATDAVLRLRRDIGNLAPGGRDAWRSHREADLDHAVQMVHPDWSPKR